MMIMKMNGNLSMSKVSLQEFNDIKSGRITYSELMDKFERLSLEEKISSIKELKEGRFKLSDIKEEDFIDDELFKEFNNQLYLYVMTDKKKIVKHRAA